MIVPHFTRLPLLVCLLLGLVFSLGSQNPKPLVVGIATGFPPYQYSNATGIPAGIDADITRLVFKELGMGFVFSQRPWDAVYLDLAHRVPGIDLLCGAEINAERQTLFDFSQGYYQRISLIFVRADSHYRSLEDLDRKTITGDRASFIEQLIASKRLRVLATSSKEESFQKLRDGQVDAVIAPQEVGNWLCKQMKLAVRTISQNDPGSSVGFAVAKGNTKLAELISEALRKLKARGSLETVFASYR